MLTTLRNAFKVKDVRKKLLYTFIMLVIIRFGSNLPIPGVNTTFFKDFFAKQSGDAFGFFNAITGGSFESLSVLALSITPYITSSIIIQLLTIAIPALEELQQDGEDGRKKIVEYTRYLTIALALLQSSAMAIGFGKQNLLIHYSLKSVIVTVVTMTAGSAFLMWIGERITEKGIGNGISIVLLLNILSSLPSDFSNLYERFLKNQTVARMVVAAAIIIAFIIVMVIFTIILQDAERRIPVQYSSKMQGRRSVGGTSSHTSITFNPLEVANNMKKSGGFIPGIRPGKPTSDYFSKILSYIIIIGATGLIIVCIIPIIISGLFNISRLSFTGTSLIIIVGVVLETIKAIESQMLVRNYRGFLLD